MTINQRIAEIIKYKDLSIRKFAINIGTTAQTLNGILKNRNFPSYPILEGIVLKYPDINSEWLLTGTGEMCTQNNILNEPINKYKTRKYLEQRVDELESQMKQVFETLKLK